MRRYAKPNSATLLSPGERVKLWYGCGYSLIGDLIQRLEKSRLNKSGNRIKVKRPEGRARIERLFHGAANHSKTGKGKFRKTPKTIQAAK